MFPGITDIAAYAALAEMAGYVAVIPPAQLAVAPAGTSVGSGCAGGPKRWHIVAILPPLLEKPGDRGRSSKSTIGRGTRSAGKACQGTRAPVGGLAGGGAPTPGCEPHAPTSTSKSATPAGA